MARTISITGAGLEMVTIGSPFADSPSLVNIVLRSDSISPGSGPGDSTSSGPGRSGK